MQKLALELSNQNFTKLKMLREEYDNGLEKVAKEDLNKLQDTLEYALNQDMKLLDMCIKQKGQGECSADSDRVARRKENLNVIERARTTTPLGFAQYILYNIVASGRRPGNVPPIEDPDTGYMDRKANPEHHHKPGAAGDLSRYEMWEKIF
jgi:hypothetical protein